MNRDLDGCERFYWIANQWSPNNVVAACELEGELEPRHLRTALTLLVERHPLLRHVVLADASGAEPRFVRQRAPIAQLACASFLGQPFSQGMQGLVEVELNAFIDPAEALFRVTYAAGSGRSAVIVTLLHIIADATAAMNALRDLLQFYALARRDAAPKVSSLPERPPYTDMLAPRLRAPRSLPRVLSTQAQSTLEQLHRMAARLPAERLLPLAERRNGLIRCPLDEGELTRLRSACRRHEVSVHGILTAALALAVGDELGLRTRRRAMLNVGSPVSFRERLEPPPRDELGSYVSTLPLQLDIGHEQAPFRVARQVNRELDQRKQRDEELAMMQLAQWVTPGSHGESARFVELAEARGPGNVCISNIGAVEFPTEVAGVAVRHAHWAASLSVTGYLLACVCSTARGLELDLTYVEGLVSRARAERIASQMMCTLRAVCEAEVCS